MPLPLPQTFPLPLALPPTPTPTPNQVSAVTDFEWVSQLRYYWEEKPSAIGETNLLVRMVQCTFPYGYEYLGASSRLVINET